MPNLPPLGLVFTALAVIFVGLAFKDYLKGEGKLTPARKVWLRIGLIFAIVSIGLVLVQMLRP